METVYTISENLPGMRTIILSSNIAGLFRAYGGRTMVWHILAKRTQGSKGRAGRVETSRMVRERFFMCLPQPWLRRSLSANLSSRRLWSK